MSKHKNSYIKYKRAELEDYIRHPESCVKKIRTTEALKFAPNIIANFTESIMRILSKKVGKYDVKLNGVVLDFRKTKVLDTGSIVRNDSTSMLINIESDFYVFSPRNGAIVNGIVKYINRQAMETIISVVIYRVFNVKVTFKGCIKPHDFHQDQEIQIRIKNYNFDNVLPLIEGEMISLPNARKRINFDDAVDSGISESSVSFNNSLVSDVVIKREKVDVQNDEPINSFDSGTRKRKRKDEHPEITQPAKRIKQEVIIEEVTPTIKQERISESEEQEIKETPKNKVKTTGDTSTTQKKKKKKRKSCDFESSLLMLFGSPQVKELNQKLSKN